MEPLRTPPRLCPPRSVGRPSGARTPVVQRRAKPARPSPPPRPDRTRRLSPAPSVGPSPPNTSWASWPRPMPPPLNPAPSGPCSAGKASTPRTWSTWRREREAGMLKGLTPHKRGPKSKRNPQEEELQKLRRENQHLTEELRKAAIVIDVQKKWARCWAGPCRRWTPRSNPDGRGHPVGPHGGRPRRLRFPRGRPRFLLSATPCAQPAGIAGAPADFALSATGSGACPQFYRTGQRAGRLTCRAISGPLARGRPGHFAG